MCARAASSSGSMFTFREQGLSLTQVVIEFEVMVSSDRIGMTWISDKVPELGGYRQRHQTGEQLGLNTIPVQDAFVML